jgi:Probable zinc-ribbon domain
MYGDKALTCADCSQDFIFTASEQEFYATRGFTDPRRCSSCRASRKAARGDWETLPVTKTRVPRPPL